MFPITAMVPRSTSIIPALLIVPSISLFIAYLWARASRPDLPPLRIPDSGSADTAPGGLGRYMGYGDVGTGDEHLDWPSWYGKGKTEWTPYDYRPPSRLAHGVLGDADAGNGGRMRVLLDSDIPPDSPLVPYTMALLATLRVADEADIFPLHATSSDLAPNGVYRSEDTEEEERRWQETCQKYDLVWRLDADADRDGRKRRKCTGVPIMSERLQGGIPDPTADIILLESPGHLLENATSYPRLKQIHGDDWNMGLFGHILPAADPSIYYPSNPTRRKITYFPSQHRPKADRPVFPYSARWHVFEPRVMPEKMLKRLKSAGQGGEGLDWWEETDGLRSEVRNWVLKEEARRANAMRKSGICLFENWQDGLTIEMVQAMLSGCVVVGLVPDIKRDHFKDIIFPLPLVSDFEEKDPNIPILHIEHVLRSVPTSVLDRMALRAFMFARRELVLRRKVEDVRGLLEIWARGGRGYQFTSEFKWTCSTTSSGERPPWCSD